MNFMDFTFEEPGRDLLSQYGPGESLPVSGLLTAMDGQSMEDLETVLDALEQKGVTVSLEDLPAYTADSETALRLRREAQLVQQGKLLESLEENDPLRLYLQELAARPVCGDLVAYSLELKQAQDPQDPIYTRVMDLCLSRVVELAGTFAGKGVLMLDLIQEGSMYLWQRLLSYDGQDIEQYRDAAICGGMTRAVVLQAHFAGVGQHLRQTMEDYRSVDERLLMELGRNPTLEEIAQAMHLTPEQAAVVENMVKNARELNRAKHPEDSQQLPQEEEQAVEDTAYFQMRQRIAELLSALDERSAKLLTLRYGLEGGAPLDPAQTGRQLGMTPEEVVAAEAAALSKLRTQ